MDRMKAVATKSGNHEISHYSLEITANVQSRIPWWFSGTQVNMGFIVELKSDSGYGVLSKCQQIVINKRGVLQNEDASMVFGTTFCVPLSTTYSIRVRAYPVPMGTEKDKDIFTKAMFTSRTCEEVYGAHHCKDWAPTNITIFGSDNTVSIEFDSAPDEYNIRYYLVYYRGFEEESWRMKMVVSSDLTDSPSKEVYYVFPETESVPKVVFIVAPLLVMVTGVALGFTIVFVSSAKKKVAMSRDAGYSQMGLKHLDNIANSCYKTIKFFDRAGVYPPRSNDHD
ncbi:I17RD protein, partial [Polypterus senegalus]